MFHSGVMHVVGKVVWVLSAVAALNIGLKAFNYDFYAMDFVALRPSLELTIRYLMLASGVVSLAMFAMSCTSGCCCACGSKEKM